MHVQTSSYFSTGDHIASNGLELKLPGDTAKNLPRKIILGIIYILLSLNFPFPISLPNINVIIFIYCKKLTLELNLEVKSSIKIWYDLFFFIIRILLVQ